MTPTGPKDATAPSASPSPSSDEPGNEAAIGLRIETWGEGGPRSFAGLEVLAEMDQNPAELTRAVARRLGLHPLVTAERVAPTGRRPAAAWDVPRHGPPGRS